MQLLSETIRIQVPVEVGGQIFVVFVASDSRKGVFMWYPIDMRSFRPTTFRLDLSPFARWNTTLYNTVKILIKDVILVKLGFHMCIPCLYACFFFFWLKKRQIHIEQTNCSRAKRTSREMTQSRYPNTSRLRVDPSKAETRFLLSCYRCLDNSRVTAFHVGFQPAFVGRMLELTLRTLHFYLSPWILWLLIWRPLPEIR